MEAPELVALLQGRRVAVLTGAGMSTDSGIPDYRGPDSPPSNPMTIGQFMSDRLFRQRYWARNHVGWRHMDETLPNAGHRALAALERAGAVSGVITQNVDLLHTKAGSRNVVNLHGTYAEVICLDCGHTMTRAALADMLEAANPGLSNAPRRSAASPSPPTPTRSSATRLRSQSSTAPPAAACSSPTSSTSAKVCRKTVWRRRMRWSTAPMPCWWPGRR